MHPLQHTRNVLLAAIRELLGLAEEHKADAARHEGFVLEATRLTLRLVKVQNQIEEHDLD